MPPEPEIEASVWSFLATLGLRSQLFSNHHSDFFKKKEKLSLLMWFLRIAQCGGADSLAFEVGVVGVGSSAVSLATLWTFSQVLHLSEP